MSSKLSDDFAELNQSGVPRTVLVVDDSVVARNQIKRCLAGVQLESVLLNDGKQALEHLTSLVREGKNLNDEYLMVISDIEMPEMDGYTFTRKVKEDPAMKHIYILLNT